MSKTKTVKRTDNIEKMDFDQLRKAVQLLRDDVDLWKRKYEDAIQNLDESNFSKSFTVTQNRMKAQFKIAADVIKSAVTEDDLAQELTKYSNPGTLPSFFQTAKPDLILLRFQRTLIKNRFMDLLFPFLRQDLRINARLIFPDFLKFIQILKMHFAMETICFH